MPTAHGTFTVDVRPLAPPPAEGLGRFSINKRISGDLDATTQGEMFTAGNPRQGEAGYVAVELVAGTLSGHKGGFALQHFATMDARGPNMQVIVVPGSGTGELAGLSGTFTIRIENGQHFYDLEYSLPGQQLREASCRPAAQSPGAPFHGMGFTNPFGIVAEVPGTVTGVTPVSLHVIGGGK